jgi:quercetin dioxygenase-like cupin family protein
MLLKRSRGVLRIFCSSSGCSTMRYTTFASLLFLAGVGGGMPLGFALSQVSPQMRVEVVFDRIVSELPKPVNLRVHDDRWDPGAETGVHDHPGPVILAVIEGELVEETPAGRNELRAGNVVWRAARETHNVKNVSDKPARILAIHFDPM